MKVLNGTLKKINEFTGKINSSANGVAIFACDGADGFFKTIQFNVPFKNDRFFVFNRPHFFPLARLIDQNPKYAVVLADTKSANIFVVQRGRIIDREEVESETTGDTRTGALSHSHYQSHVEEMHKRHAKEIIEELEKVVRERRYSPSRSRRK